MRFGQLGRREFITLVGGAAAAWPLAAGAQQPAGMIGGAPRSNAQNSPKIFTVGILTAGTPAMSGALNEAFERGLNELGYKNGQNIVIERVFAEGRLERLPALASELVAHNVDVLFAPTAAAVVAAQKATQSIPIVFALVTDPVGEGFVKTLSVPGGNATGLTTISVDLAAKRLELLKEAFPEVSRVGVLYFQVYPGVKLQLEEITRAATILGNTVESEESTSPEDFSRAFESMKDRHSDGYLVIENPMFFANRLRITELAAQTMRPAIYGASEYVDAGGLMSYGANYSERYKQAAQYVVKILNGQHPETLPVAQPTKFELVLNMKTAKALGITVPPQIVARADEVIE